MRTDLLDEPSASSTRLAESSKSANAGRPLKTAVDLWRHERAYAALGHRTIAGVDEAGRGPLAGPVVAACVIVPCDFSIEGIDDSKRLTAQQREAAYHRLIGGAEVYAVGIVDSQEIDRINILKATHAAMRKAVSALPLTPHVLLIDGLPVPNLADCVHCAIVGGDALSVSIAAASIIAKVTRDRLMCDLAEVYPEYGFAQHKGYGCPQHLEALRRHGPCPIHRRSFSPVAVLCEPNLF